MYVFMAEMKLLKKDITYYKRIFAKKARISEGNIISERTRLIFLLVIVGGYMSE